MKSILSVTLYKKEEQKQREGEGEREREREREIPSNLAACLLAQLDKLFRSINVCSFFFKNCVENGRDENSSIF